jgi:hypothetical protein
MDRPSIPSIGAALALSLATMACHKTAPPAGEAGAPSPVASASAPTYPVPVSKEDAAKLLATALGDAKSAAPPCSALASNAIATAFAMATPDAAGMKSNEVGYVAIARCAEGQHAYHLMLAIASALEDADPEGGHPELSGRALLGFDMFRPARARLVDAATRDPKDAEVPLALAKLSAHEGRWQDASDAADLTMKTLGALDAKDKKETAWRAQKYKARAMLHLGKLPDAAQAVAQMTADGAPAAETTDLGDRIDLAKAKKIAVDIRTGPRVPLGYFDLYGHSALGAFATVYVENLDAAEHQYEVTASIDGVTDASGDCDVKPGMRGSARLEAELKPGYDPKSVKNATPAKLAVHVRDAKANAELYATTLDVTLDPVDTVPLAHAMEPDGSAVHDTPDLVAWKMRGHPSPTGAVRDRIVQQKPKKSTDLAKIVLDEMKDMKFTPGPVRDESQATVPLRTVAAIRSGKSGTTLEGALLAAALLGSVGLDAHLVLAPDRVLVGWAPGKDETDPQNEEGFFLDVARLASFDDALKEGQTVYARERDAHHFERLEGAPPVTALVDVRNARQSYRSRGVR